MSIPPATPLPVAVRAYAPPPQRRREQIEPSEHTVIFDTETTGDTAQALRFGAFQVRLAGEMLRAGVFYEPEILRAAELELLAGYARSHDLELLTRDEFADDIFYTYVADLGGICIGFNLPFDISRIAINHVRPSGRNRNGFSFEISRDEQRDRVRVVHRSSTSAQIEFAPRHKRRANDLRGHFVDVRTVARALTGTSHSLASLTEHLQTNTRKSASEEHGVGLAETYIDYAVGDPQATWECYAILSARYESYRLTQTPLTRVSSEATVGKGCLREMGVVPWQQTQPGFSPEMIGQIISSYSGGRAEVRARKTVVEIAHCDFKSMYSTVCALQGLWSFVIANGMETYDATDEVLDLLEHTTTEDWRHSNKWKSLHAIVEVQPDGDFFPVRAQYGGEEQYGVGQNYLSSSSGETFYFTLADCISSKLRTGKAPTVVRAVGYRALQPQWGLRQFDIAGNPDYRVDPYTEDFYARLIDLRAEVKQQAKHERRQGNDALANQLDAEQQALKITASATSYGIFIELNPEELDKPGLTDCYGLDGEGFQAVVRRYEQPGRFFHPLLATLITGAARLMLTIAELLADRQGLDWAFCDTDSLAFIRPTGMTRDHFDVAVNDVREWFGALSPYEVSGDLLELEDTNYRLRNGKGTGPREPLYCYAISPKRYVLFNLNTGGTPILRKVSGHGLGHLLAPYEEHEAPASIPEPQASLRDLEAPRWQHDLWYRIVEADLAERDVDLSDMPGLNRPAMASCAVTTRAVERWFQKHNRRRKTYAEKTRPFGFLITPTVTSFAKPLGNAGQLFHLVAPYEKHPDQWLDLEYIDIYSGATFQISTERYDERTAQAQSYRTLFRRYVDHADPKRLGSEGTPCRQSTRGMLEPRHVDAFHIEQIGKETNQLERVQAGIAHENQEIYTHYTSPKRDTWRTLTVPVLNIMPRAELLARAPLHDTALRDVLAGRAQPHPSARGQLERIAIRHAREQLASHGHDSVSRHPLAALHTLASQQQQKHRCPTCATDLDSARATYCSDACRQAAYRQRTISGAGSARKSGKP